MSSIRSEAIADDIQRLIDKELSSCVSLDNAHGISIENIANHRIAPEVREFENCGGPPAVVGSRVVRWVVLDEAPNSSRSRYLVVYDPTSGTFGLATSGDSKCPAVWLGNYGSFINTLEAM